MIMLILAPLVGVLGALLLARYLDRTQSSVGGGK